MSASRQPTHRLKVKERDGAAQGDVGVAWLNEDGSLSIVLNPCIVLSYDGLKSKHLTAFPIGPEEKKARADSTKKAAIAKAALDAERAAIVNESAGTE